MKGVISIIELAAAAILLFIVFGILFPPFKYEHRWEDATILLRIRDAILSLDRIGKLYEYSFNPSKLSAFLDKLIEEKEFIRWSETEGTFKSRIFVACNCTKEQITNLTKWIGKTKINERYVELDFVQTNLDNIIPSDVLFIWGYKSLSEYYASIKNYIQKGNGIIEMMDFTGENAPGKVNNDRVQTEIFGIRYVDLDNDTVNEISFSYRPSSVKEPVYYTFKHFYHIPLPIIAEAEEERFGDCPIIPQPKGNLNLNESKFAFWICSQTSVWFDTNGDGIEDELVGIGESFLIFEKNLTLSYIESDRIGIKFNEPYTFNDFLGYIAPPGEPSPPGKALGIYRVYDIQPIDDNEKRILLYGISESPPRNYSALIANISQISRVAWLTDLSKNGREVQDDEKLLLLSLLLWASNKRSVLMFGEMKVGLLTSYINVVNKDMFEVYEFSLGMGYPY